MDVDNLPNPKDPVQKVRNSLGVPEMLEDAIPSSIAQKMMRLVLARGCS